MLYHKDVLVWCEVVYDMYTESGGCVGAGFFNNHAGLILIIIKMHNSSYDI